MTSLELLQEIDAWLSFNNSPSKEQISELRNDIKKHLAEQLSIHDVNGSFISKFQEIIYSDFSDSEIVNALHRLDNNR